MEALLDRYARPDFALGDNGGRLRHGRRPPLFERAERRGIRVLPGSDPLPFPHHQVRAGSYGVRLAATLDAARPGRDLYRALVDETVEWAPFGQREGLLPFLRNQVAMQFRKRFGEAA